MKKKAEKKKGKGKKIFWVSVSVLMVLLVGLSYATSQNKANDEASIEEVSSPRIESLSFDSGPVGTEVVIHGDGFSFSKNYIKFGSGYFGYLTSSDGKTLIFTVPENITIGCDKVDDFIEKNYVQCPHMSEEAVKPQEYPLEVVTVDGRSNPVSFVVVSE